MFILKSYRPGHSIKHACHTLLLHATLNHEKTLVLYCKHHAMRCSKGLILQVGDLWKRLWPSWSMFCKYKNSNKMNVSPARKIKPIFLQLPFMLKNRLKILCSTWVLCVRYQEKEVCHFGNQQCQPHWSLRYCSIILYNVFPCRKH